MRFSTTTAVLLAALCFLVQLPVLAQLATRAPQPATSNPLSLVNPFIGTDGHGHTYPGATTPFGMVQLSPDTRLEGWDGCSGYHYSDSLIYGFSHTHLSGTGVADYCDILFQPYVGKIRLEPQEYAAHFQKSDEHAEPGYYAVRYDKEDISIELTATERVGVHRYTYPKNREFNRILIDLRHRDEVINSSMTVVNDHELVGYRISRSWAKDQRIYFVIRFSRPFFDPKVIDMTLSPRSSQRSVKSKAIFALLDFYGYEGLPVVATVGLSAVSVEGARKNLEAECNHFDFDKVKAEAQAKWAAQLGKINVEGGTEAQKTTFYTALYHTMLAPNLYSDTDGRYRGRDMEIHETQGHHQYTVFSLWDTYRACNPLYTILEPKRTADFIQTFLRQYEQGGLLPIWELGACETDCMIGNHAIPVIADAWRKGIRGYDGNKALDAMLTSANQDRYGLKWYKSLGYIPSDEEPESVSKTLEYAFDDWCIAQMAQDLGRKDVYTSFMRRAQQYKNTFDPSTGFFRAKNNSTWHVPFDPFEVNFNYTEANAWQYRYAAPQDVSGMMRLAGGRNAFAAQLDSLFTAHAKTTGRQQADITGLIGQYVQGNEPSHHMAYLYNFAGQPWKTQQRVRQIMDEQYSDRPDGLSGNEDCGQMSAWYVLSALGFYPVVPASGQYVIGTPLFEKAVIQLDNGNTFTIDARGASARRRYIQSAYLNGQPLTKTWFTHDDLLKGGEIRLQMTDKPSVWGKNEADCPVSAIESEQIVPIPYITGAKRVFQETQTIKIGCADTAAAIFYLIENNDSVQALQYLRYDKPLVIHENTVLKFYAEREGRKSPVAGAEFFKLRSDLRVLRYATKYNPQYTGGGEQALVDLQPGGADFRSGRWQGYEGVNLDAVIDLGSIKTPRQVSVNFLQDENSWIFFPTKLQVQTSNDGEHFTPAGEITTDIPPTTPGALQHKWTVSLGGSASARYIRVVGVSLGQCPAGHKGAGNPCWLFVDEVEVE